MCKYNKAELLRLGMAQHQFHIHKLKEGVITNRLKLLSTEQCLQCSGV